MGNEVEKMPVKKAIPMVILALIMVLGVSLLLVKLDLCIWVVWLGMATWASFGMSLEMKDILKAWCSGAFGLFLGYALTSGNQLLLIVGAICVLVFVFGMVSHRFGMLCNNYTALFLTCCTASGIVLEPIQLGKSIVFGYLIFGVLPWGVVTLMKKKKEK
ncbi:MAG: hypothetical protein ACI4TF_12255 [Oliverpabstia sp.]